MRRDMTLVREVLLKVEALDIPPGAKFVLRADRGFDEDEADIRVDGFEADEIDRHLRLLVDAGFLTGKVASDGVVSEGLSWAGCEFLDTVRSPEVWKKTEAAASKIGGVGITVFADVAKAVAKGLLKEKLGLDLA